MTKKSPCFLTIKQRYALIEYLVGNKDKINDTRTAEIGPDVTQALGFFVSSETVTRHMKKLDLWKPRQKGHKGYSKVVKTREQLLMLCEIVQDVMMGSQDRDTVARRLEWLMDELREELNRGE